MSAINNIQDEIIEEFSGLSDWMDQYAYIIELGNAVEPLEEKFKTPDNIIEGCQSRVWLVADEQDGKIDFRADSDAIISPMASAIRPDTPVSISSKMTVGSFLHLASIDLIASIIRDSSPPDAMRSTAPIFVVRLAVNR